MNSNESNNCKHSSEHQHEGHCCEHHHEHEHSHHHHHEHEHDHHHHHGHGHHHHHHVQPSEGMEKVFIISICLNFIFVAVESIVGWTYNSVSLLSDAGHNLSDVFSLIISFLAFKMAKYHATKRFSYGYKKGTVLASLINSVILLVAVGAIIVESIYKFKYPVPTDGAAISITAGIGILINGATALLLMRGQKNDINIRGAFLHMALDAIVSLGVVISGIAIMITGINAIDSIMSLIIAAMILVSIWNVLKESTILSLDGVPESVNIDEVKQKIVEIEGVKNLHHLHVWAISTTQVAATLHIVVDNIDDVDDIRKRVKSLLSEHGIEHSTVECERNACCEDSCC